MTIQYGWTKIIAHLAWQPGWKAGDVVEHGWELCNLGNTGQSTGPHAHLGENDYTASQDGSVTDLLDCFRRMGSSNNVKVGKTSNPQWWADIVAYENGFWQSLGYMVSDGEVYVDPKKHLGIDLAGNNSSGIKAPFKLVVRQVGYDDSFGFYIIFEEIYEIPDPIPEPTVPTVKNIVICGQYQPLAGLSIAVPPEILELRVDNPVLHKLDGIWDYVLMDNYYGLPVGTRFGIEEQLNKK